MEKERLENKNTREKIINDFFSELDKISTEKFPYKVDRSVIDGLIERGVSVEDVLRIFIQKGFLLHGSSVSGLSYLEPRQANDNNGSEEGNRTAVYAADNPKPAMFRALVSGIDGVSTFVINEDSVLEDEVSSFATDFDVPLDRGGSVYILDKKSFQEAGGLQFTSSTTVVPLYEIPIKKSDFPYEIKRIEK